MEAKRHSYSKDRACMACGGAVCNMDYMDLRKQVEERRGAPMGDVRAGVDSKPSIAKGMMMPLGKMAKGGKVEELHHSPAGGSANRAKGAARVRAEEGQEGINPSTSVYRPGESHAGSMHRSGNPEHAKAAHKQTLSELKSMKKPELYADGGEVYDYDEYGNIKSKKEDKSGAQVVSKSISDAFGMGEAHADEPQKKADGGEIESSGDDDEMMMDHCAGECMEAIEKKDKAAFKDALHVLVADLIKKLG